MAIIGTLFCIWIAWRLVVGLICASIEAWQLRAEERDRRRVAAWVEARRVAAQIPLSQ